MKAKFTVLMLISFVLSGIGQTIKSNNVPQAINVYLNCSDCYADFVKTEIKFVNYVRDRQSADVDLFIRSQQAGTENTAYTLCFIGLQKFASISDTLTYLTKTGSMEDDNRKGLLQVIKLGLIRYVSHSPFASEIQIENPESETTDTTVIEDKWKSWVVNINATGSMDGEKSVFNQNYSGSISANKTTEQIKIDLGVNSDYGESTYISSTDTLKSYSKSQSGYAQIIKSINKHWSCGAFANTGNGTYSNKKFYASFAPALEFNLFPYSQSQSKLLTIGWFVSGAYFNYTDTTIYDKIHETTFQNRLNISFAVTQPWGSASISLQGSHYFNDYHKNNFAVYVASDLHVFKGLYFNIFIAYAFVHDQLSLRKEGVTQEEQLLHQKELATSYFFNFNCGITYRFGSKYNNVVNPRLTNGG